MRKISVRWFLFCFVAVLQTLVKGRNITMPGRKLAFALSVVLLFASGHALALDRLLLLCTDYKLMLPDREERKLRAQRDDDVAKKDDAQKEAGNAVKELVKLNCDTTKNPMTAECEYWNENAAFWAHKAVFWEARAAESELALATYLAQRNKQRAETRKASCTQALGPPPAQQPASEPAEITDAEMLNAARERERRYRQNEEEDNPASRDKIKVDLGDPILEEYDAERRKIFDLEELPEDSTTGPVRENPQPPTQPQPPSTSNTGTACSATDAEAFSKMIGSWHWYRMNVTIGGSCQNATGSYTVKEWCAGVDDPGSKDAPSVVGTLQGRMEGGSLKVNYSQPASQNGHPARSGSGSCSLSGNELSCSGFGCDQGNLQKQ